jgi:hypothetical protein
MPLPARVLMAVNAAAVGLLIATLDDDALSGVIAALGALHLLCRLWRNHVVMVLVMPTQAGNRGPPPAWRAIGPIRRSPGSGDHRIFISRSHS